VKGFLHIDTCPSIAKHGFHFYSAGGRLNVAASMLKNGFKYSDKILDMVYNCQMCGACGVSCNYAMDMEVLEPISEFRIKCVEDGQTIPALDRVIGSLQKQGTMVAGAKAKRGEWAKGLDVKDYTKQKAKVIYHAGCRTCFDKDLWNIARTTVEVLKKAGVDVGIAGENEPCCGGRAYQMGYKEDLIRQAKQNMELFTKSGAEILVTGCADCYHAFKVLYDKFGLKGNLEVLHITEYVDRLIKEGKLKPRKKVSATVTYHDPCHLGRLGEPYVHWNGKKIPGQRHIFEPQKIYRRGTYGVYEPPRAVLSSIPGLKLVEMDRTKEYAWCCGAGGGVKESNPEFAQWTASQRIEEAICTGAEALVTACPGCESTFNEAIKASGSDLKVYDVIELLAKAI
jgi:Fe-S oxidoreductase